MSKQGALLLLPNLLGDIKHHEPYLPASVDKAVIGLDGLIAESEKGGRRFLSRFATDRPAHEIPIALFNEHTPLADIDFLLEPLRNGERWGLLSDAGLPCVADPGAPLVFRARQLGLNVQAFIGPSSVILSLMLSGLSGQRFTFHGYLSKNADERAVEIQRLEETARRKDYTQIFMEAPYRAMQMQEALMETLKEDTFLSMAWDLTLPTQKVLTQTVATWKKSPMPNLQKRNVIFLIGQAIISSATVS